MPRITVLSWLPCRRQAEMPCCLKRLMGFCGRDRPSMRVVMWLGLALVHYFVITVTYFRSTIINHRGKEDTERVFFPDRGDTRSGKDLQPFGRILIPERRQRRDTFDLSSSPDKSKTINHLRALCVSVVIADRSGFTLYTSSYLRIHLLRTRPV